MTATEHLIAKQVSDVFPAGRRSPAPGGGKARPGRPASQPARSAGGADPRSRSSAATSRSAPGAALDHQALNQAAAEPVPRPLRCRAGIVYAAGVDHAYHLAREFRAAGLKRRPSAAAHRPSALPRRLLATSAARSTSSSTRNCSPRLELAARDRGHAPRPDCQPPRLPAAHRPDHAASPARKEAGVVVDFVPKSATHRACRLVTQPSRCRLLPKAPASRLRRGGASSDGHAASSPRAMVGTGDARRPPSPRGHRPRVAACGPLLDDDEQQYWASIAGRQVRFDERADFAKLTESGATRGALEQFLMSCAAENPPPAADRAVRPRRHGHRPGQLRRPGHPRDAGAAVGKGPSAGCARTAARNR